MNRLFLILYSVQQFLWDGPMLVLLLGTHLYFTVKLHIIQRKIPQGIRLSLSKHGQGKEGISSFSALATALAATIGTGNIIGISTAIAIGGPGAVFWCWLTGMLGVATCYAECFLSVKYRIRKEDGTYCGGPMYVMHHVLHQKSAAVLFSAAVILVSFGMGSSVQSHAIYTAVTELADVNPKIIGIAAALLTGLVILGGANQIAKVCTWLVPVMSALYLGGCLVLLWLNRAYLGETLAVIVQSAVGIRPAVGGFAGSAVMAWTQMTGARMHGLRLSGMGGGWMAGMQTGIERGLFTNEAGLGSIPMSAASADSASPDIQGLVSMTGPFWDTGVMCAVTGIAIVSSIVKNPERFTGVRSDRLCFLAFEQLPVLGSEILSVSLVLFAFATIIGWHYYGECAVRYLGNEREMRMYQFLYIAAVYAGAVLSLDTVWMLSDIFNVLMAVPNLFCLWILRNHVGRKT